MEDQGTAVLRLLLSLGLGFALGFERELRGQHAGLRTHILVCLGSCLFTLSSLFTVHPLGANTPDEVRADITRIASQVVVGIGFLGGGAILRHGSVIKGLTTAANLWLTASVGLATGLGLHMPAIVTTVLALMTLVGLRYMEHGIAHVRRKYRLSDMEPPPEDPQEEAGDESQAQGPRPQGPPPQ